MKIETTIERIEILIDHMENQVEENTFNFGIWGSPGFQSGVSCGTLGCAIGHASTMKYFYDLGLRLYAYGSTTVYPKVIDSQDREYKGHDAGIKILQRIFGGTEQLMKELFIPCAGPDTLTSSCTPKQWAKQARKIVKRLREKHGIPTPQPQSSPQEQKQGQAGWRGLLETPRNLASDRLGGCHAKYTRNGQSSCSESQS